MVGRGGRGWRVGGVASEVLLCLGRGGMRRCSKLCEQQFNEVLRHELCEQLVEEVLRRVNSCEFRC